MGGRGGAGDGIGWVGDPYGSFRAYLARRRAKSAVLNATEAMMARSGQPIGPWYRRIWRWLAAR
jgi:hypothetical protein